MRWAVEIRRWDMPPGKWHRLWYYKRYSWAVWRMEQCLRLAIRFPGYPGQSIRMVKLP